jgi:glycosyltransferase involved in cell wall biosynthesis
VNLWVVLFGRTFDVIHAHGRSGITLHMCGKLKPVVQTVHGIFTMEQSLARDPGKLSLDQKLHTRWATYHQKRMHRFCDALIAVSYDTVKGMLDSDPDLSREKIHVIPNGILPISTLGMDFNGCGHILFAGRLSETKGVEALIEAMPYTRDDIQLSIIGDGPLRGALEHLAKNLVVDQRVHFLGCLPRHELYGWMRNSIAVITPSRYEPQGIVLLEAAALGKAIVAANTSGIPEFIEDRKNGLLVSSGSPEELARAINEISERPHFAAMLGLNARRKVMYGYQWKDLCSDIVRIYQSHAA